MKFELDEKEQAAADAFFEEEDRKAYAIQTRDCEYCSGLFVNKGDEIKCIFHVGGHPYYGASGGSRSYRFTPSGVGTFVEVEHGFTGAKKDITNMDGW